MNRHNETIAVLLGAITSTVLGAWFLQAIGAFVLGVLGAAGGYIFGRYVKPWLDNITKKHKDKAL